jgi:triosephosphate isomerase (TIM)
MMFERTPMIAGNWKMNLRHSEAKALVNTIAEGMADVDGIEVLVAPPFTHLAVVREGIGDAGIFLAGQNMHWEMRGAFTGEISGRMLQEATCTHVILGHSERRILFHETSETVDLKVKAATFLGLIPIVCVGETLEEREAGKTFEVIRAQLEGSLHNYKADQLMRPSTILAYEPVWAIGTGRTATPDQAQEVHQFIRKWIEDTFNTGAAAQVRVLYGGSVKPENIGDLMSQPDIDGALVGGASLNGESFVQIVRYKAV